MELKRRKTKNGDRWVVRFHYKGKYPSLCEKEWLCDAISKTEMKKIALPFISRKMVEIDDEELKRKKESHSLGYLFDSYISYSSAEKEDTTITATGTFFRCHFFTFYSREDEPSVINYKSACELKQRIVNSGVQTSSMNMILSNIRQFIKYLVLMDELNANEAEKACMALKGVKIDTSTRSEKYKNGNFWNKEEVTRFLESFEHDDPFRYLFLTMFYTGTRFSECIALKFSDFDYKTGILKITRQATPGARSVKTTLKTEASYKPIRVNKKALEEILEYKKLINANSNDYMFFPMGFVKRSRLTDIFNKHIRDLGLKPITFHGLRHSYASVMMNSELKFNITTVCEEMRHKDPSTTLHFYTHKFEETDKGKIDLI